MGRTHHDANHDLVVVGDLLPVRLGKSRAGRRPDEPHLGSVRQRASACDGQFCDVTLALCQHQRDIKKAELPFGSAFRGSDGYALIAKNCVREIVMTSLT